MKKQLLALLIGLTCLAGVALGLAVASVVLYGTKLAYGHWFEDDGVADALAVFTYVGLFLAWLIGSMVIGYREDLAKYRSFQAKGE